MSTSHAKGGPFSHAIGRSDALHLNWKAVVVGVVVGLVVGLNLRPGCPSHSSADAYSHADHQPPVEEKEKEGAPTEEAESGIAGKPELVHVAGFRVPTKVGPDTLGLLLIDYDLLYKEILGGIRALFIGSKPAFEASALVTVVPHLLVSIREMETVHNDVRARLRAVGFTGPMRDHERRVGELLQKHLLVPDGLKRPPGAHKLGLVVPVRNRQMQMEMFRQVMPAFLERQRLDFHIFFVEQASMSQRFNRAKLLNIGVVQAIQEGCDYFALHDVDMLPLFDSVDYHFPLEPTHLATCVQQFDWGMPYPNYFGGVTLISRQHMLTINGFSNNYWGWGGEDDDFLDRVKSVGLSIRRDTPICERGIFKSVEEGHTRRDMFEDRRVRLGYSSQIMWIDGINSLTYEVESREDHPEEHWSLIKVQI